PCQSPSDHFGCVCKERGQNPSPAQCFPTRSAVAPQHLPEVTRTPVASRARPLKAALLLYTYIGEGVSVELRDGCQLTFADIHFCNQFVVALHLHKSLVKRRQRHSCYCWRSPQSLHLVLSLL
uniref:Uncharacterized protein n=1 Tax=Malurus cyaneus samueli TaxID=2593467 RepID=A0A8C5TGE6_9PASS